MRKALLVGHDIASCQGLEAVANELTSRNWSCTTHFARGKEYGHTLETMLKNAQEARIVVLGMASQKEAAKEEIAVGAFAAAGGIPIFFYCDLFNTWARPFFADLIKQYSQLVHFFVLHDGSAQQVQKQYPGVTAFVTGKPGWEQYSSPEHTRGSARKVLGIPENEKIVLCPGGKDYRVNLIHFGAVLGASAGLFPEPTVILSIHGGDPKGRNAYMGLQDRKSLVPEIPQFRAPVILPAADLVVASMSTIGEEAGFQRIPTINFVSTLALDRHEESTGGREWAPITLGLEELVYCEALELEDIQYSIYILQERMGLYLNPDSLESRYMRKRQEEILVSRQPGTAARLMANAVESVVEK
ncbi:MAG: hypothetical protein HYT27_01975 [Parcubacteria group bacterium]|nr:hypothetical protein [Parcubacteria group bacterium]